MRLLTVFTTIALIVSIRACDYNDPDCSEDSRGYSGPGYSRGYDGSRYSRGYDGSRYSRGYDGSGYSRGYDGSGYSQGYDGSRYSRSPRLSGPEECARTCRRGEAPRTCYYHFTIEFFVTLSRACNLCRSNSTTRLIDDCQCIEGDGYEKAGLITANRMYPGPAIMVCQGDYVVVDVENRLPGNAITIHWHGIWQQGYQYADGIPYVTQCPIVEDSTFRYQWRANNPGTHFWHAHSGLHKGEGLEGAVIIRQPKNMEVNSDSWDYDNLENIIYITDWTHGASTDHFPGTLIRKPRQWPDNFLINGKGRWTNPMFGNTTTTPLAVFTVQRGFRHRFRLINACGLTCPVQLTIQGHDLTIIASDGEPLVPATVNTITSFAAERYDFVVNANQTVGSYWIQVRGIGQCNPKKLQQLAILRYESASVEPQLQMPTFDAALNLGVVFDELNVRCNGASSPSNVVCLTQLKNANRVPDRIVRGEPDVRLYLSFGFYDYVTTDIFEPGTYQRFLVAGEETVAFLGNITNVFPPSPLMTQARDIPYEQICSSTNLPPRCQGPAPCPCIHVEKIPLNAVVEIVLVDDTKIEDLSHPFHLHGHAFYLVGEGTGDYYNISRMSLANARELDSRGQIRRNLVNPPAKDTYAVPNNGFTIVRFIANNPGYWLFHCHFEFHLAVGMVAIFHIGEPRDLPPVPRGYPQCGNFVPPIVDNNNYYN